MKRRKHWKRALCVLTLLFALTLCLAATAAAEEIPETVEAHFEARQGTSEGMSAEAMAQGFINQLMYPNRVSRGVRNMGERLTGNEARAYRKLKEIIPDIAAGRRASTVLEVPLKEIAGNTVITAEGLGVSSLFSGGNLIDPAADALQKMLNLDISTLISALVEDMPYELYWFDKTAGIYTSTTMSYSNTNTRLEVSGTMRISMTVAREFAKNDLETVDTSWAQRAQAAAKNAQDIVKANSGLSDLDKLKAYKKAICDLTEYNSDATGYTPFGNPWQMIWVFDGDPATKVVCEGYSKAFKYLCDISSFRGNIIVGTASGLMVTPYGSARHMWNIVQMDDGFNYLADLTNCEPGHTGYPDLLFLKGYTSGDAASGYRYDVNGSYIRYVYDSQVNNLYYAGELEMSKDDYQDTGDKPTPTPSPTPAPSVRPGNVTGDADGVVDGRDLLRLARYLAGQDVTIDRKAADVNGDGEIDGRDLLRLARFLAGQDVELKTAP